MAWSSPRTWSSDNYIVTADDLNTEVRDNLSALKAILDNSSEYTANEVSDYSTTSTSFVDVDATNLSHTITTNGQNVLVMFGGVFSQLGSGTPVGHLNVDVDGSSYFADDGILTIVKDNNYHYSFAVLITGLSAGSHTFKLQWKQNGTNLTLYAGAGTSGYDVHPQFIVQEI